MEPFATHSKDRIDQFGEKIIHRYMKEWLGEASPPTPRGIGDDAAILPAISSQNLLFTTDSLIWNRHFDFSTEAPDAGAKLLKRNISDIAAMGGRPRFAVLSLACGGNLSIEWLEKFFRGLADSALRYGCEINGGDLSSSDSNTFVSSLAMIGTTDRPITRKAGDDGSWIWITGSLGGSILGQHLRFTPRVKEGVWLSEQPEVVAAMDLTDGLAVDLPFMVPDGLQAQLDLSFIPVSDAARAASQDSGKPAIWHAFSDGEDYELVFFTSPSTDAAAFESSWRKNFPNTPLAPVGTLNQITPGEIERSPKVAGLDGEALFPYKGFEHFG